MNSAEGNYRSPFGALDSVRLSLAHLKVWYTAGMGFFTDAYDLFIIGAILDVINSAKLSGFYYPSLEGLLASSALFAAIIGQLLVGRLADIYGRKFVYGMEAAILSAGAILSAFSPNIFWLIAFRFLLGIGVGGDYPVSSTIMSEYSNAKDRGKLVALVFANQGLGTLAAVLVGVASAALFPPDVAWRVMALIGAIPALTVIYLRRKLPETPRYSALVKGNYEEARKAARLLGADLQAKASAKRSRFSEFISRYWRVLLATTSTWFLLDVAFYGTGVYSGPIVTSILGPASSLTELILYAGIPFMVGFPGYFTAVALMDRVGRRTLQVAGFAGMAAVYAAVAAVMVQSGAKLSLLPPSVALAIYTLSFFLIDVGPNTTTFVVPTEVFPVRYRSTGHGISAAAGKAGAAVTTFLFPALVAAIGYRVIMEILVIVSVAGALLSLLLPEPKGLPLEEAAGEEIALEEPPAPVTSG